MSYGNSPKDATGIPLGNVYVPNTGLLPLEGGIVTTDSGGNQSAPLVAQVSTLPALPAGNAMIGHVIVDSGTMTVSEAALGTTGSATPPSAILIGGSDGTNLQPLQVDASKNLKVNVATGAMTVQQSVGSNLHTVIDSGTVSVGNFPVAQGVNLTEINGAAISNNNPLPITVQNWPATQPVSASALPLPTGASTSALQVAQKGVLIATAGTTTANTPYSATFSSQVNHVLIANNTTANINYEFENTATVGSDVLTPGQRLFMDIQCLTVSILTATAQNVNGTASGNIVIRGWL